MTQLMTEQGIVRVPAGTWTVEPEGMLEAAEDFFDAERYPYIKAVRA
jgi:hypothetical protein